MKKRISLGVIVIVMLVTIGFLWSHRKPSELSSENYHINAAVGPEPATIDPGKNIDGYVSVYISHIFEGLTKLDEKNSIVPGMADTWTLSDDGLKYKFNLKRGIKWSDGQDVTAHDFEYAWKRVLAPETASLYVYHFLYIKNAEAYNKGEGTATDVGIRAIDDRTLEVQLEQPTAFFLALTTLQPFFPVRQDIIEKYGDSWTQNSNTYIGNGSFVLTEWKHNESIEMAVNPNYYDKDNIKIRTISWKLIADDTSIVNAFETGEIDFLSGFYNTSELPRLMKENKVTRVNSLVVSYIIFNTTHSPLDNPDVRNALSFAIDRRTLTDNVLREGGVPAVAFIPYGMPSAGENSDFRNDAYAGTFLSADARIEEAKQLLAKAGYPDGKGLKVFDFLNANDSSNQKIAEYVQNQWEKIGVKVNINALEGKVRSQYRSEGKFDITKGSWGADYLDPNSFLTAFISASPNNYGRWKNAEYDQANAQLISARDKQSEIDAAHRAEKILMEQMPIIPLFFRNENALISPRLKGVYINPLTQISFNQAYWVK